MPPPFGLPPGPPAGPPGGPGTATRVARRRIRAATFRPDIFQFFVRRRLLPPEDVAVEEAGRSVIARRPPLFSRRTPAALAFRYLKFYPQDADAPQENRQRLNLARRPPLFARRTPAHVASKYLQATAQDFSVQEPGRSNLARIPPLFAMRVPAAKVSKFYLHSMDIPAPAPASRIRFIIPDNRVGYEVTTDFIVLKL